MSRLLGEPLVSLAASASSRFSIGFRLQRQAAWPRLGATTRYWPASLVAVREVQLLQSDQHRCGIAEELLGKLVDHWPTRPVPRAERGDDTFPRHQEPSGEHLGLPL